MPRVHKYISPRLQGRFIYVLLVMQIPEVRVDVKIKCYGEASIARAVMLKLVLIGKPFSAYHVDLSLVYDPWKLVHLRCRQPGTWKCLIRWGTL